MAKELSEENAQGTGLATLVVKRQIEKGRTLYIASDQKFNTTKGIKSAAELTEKDITSPYIRHIRNLLLNDIDS